MLKVESDTPNRPLLREEHFLFAEDFFHSKFLNSHEKINSWCSEEKEVALNHIRFNSNNLIN